ncbi:MAG TPA: efflux RND transporter periplasmic adaptor subunit [Polyangiaceae bacterium]|nr:efflux RND transporter periplasmic adaptor subunit [Polyangiaceae bacterium]
MRARMPWFVLLALGACDAKPSQPAPASAAASAHAETEHRDEPEHDALPTRVKLSPQVVTDAKIECAPATKEALTITIALPGEVSVDPDKSARVASPVSGRLTTVAFKEGSRVKKGDLLATVRIPDLAKLRAERASAGARAATLRSNATRLQELSQKGLAANQEVSNAAAEAASLEAQTRALDEQIQALGMGSSASELRLRAPIAGVVLSRTAVIGQPVTPEDTIASIADLSEVWFLARVFEKDLAAIQLGARAEVELNAFPKRRFEGRVEYLGQQIDPTARTLTARIRLANADEALRIGLFGTAQVATGSGQSQPVLVVARSAISEVAGKSVVFVRQPDGDFDMHEVVLGESNLGRMQILSGLREGESVVIQGAFTLKSALLRNSLAEEE